VIASAAACAWAALYVGALGTAVARGVRRRLTQPRARAPRMSRAVLLRPCAGDEPGLAERLAMAGKAKRVIFAVASLSDDATPAALSAVSALRARGVSAKLVVTGARGPNFKADQLARALAGLDDKPRIVIVADSDVMLESLDLVTLIGDLEASEHAAVWAPPVEADSPTLSLSNAIYNGSMHAFPVLAGMDPDGFVGKLFAIKTVHLEAIGGFCALVDCLGEDMELARRLRARGLRTSASRALARARPRNASLAELVDRLSRWVLVIRTQRPFRLLGYPLFVAASPLALVCVAVGVHLRDSAMLAAGLCVLALRCLLSLVAPQLAGLSASWASPLLAIAADSVIGIAWLRGLFRRTVAWRGRVLRLARGRLVVSSSTRVSSGDGVA
jgi:ceramide glucosyltransferase